jgi:hypothetical protein
LILTVRASNAVDTDTAEEVVNEMIAENVLPQKYQNLITGEISKLVREMTRPAVLEENREENIQKISMDLLMAEAQNKALPRSRDPSADRTNSSTLPRTNSTLSRGSSSVDMQLHMQNLDKGSLSRRPSRTNSATDTLDLAAAGMAEFGDFPCKGD